MPLSVSINSTILLRSLLPDMRRASITRWMREDVSLFPPLPLFSLNEIQSGGGVHN